jgi:hypothetical protein
MAVMLILVSPLWAGQTIDNIINNQTFDNVTTTVSVNRYLGDSQKTQFFVTYVETDTGSNMSANMTLSYSADLNNWASGSFTDQSVNGTFLTSKIISTNQTYTCWLPTDMNIPYVNMTVTCLNTTVACPILLNVYVVQKK